MEEPAERSASAGGVAQGGAEGVRAEPDGGAEQGRGPWCVSGCAPRSAIGPGARQSVSRCDRRWSCPIPRWRIIPRELSHAPLRKRAAGDRGERADWLDGLDSSDRLAAVRALVESLARSLHVPRDCKRDASWRASRERLLQLQVEMIAERVREEGTASL